VNRPSFGLSSPVELLHRPVICARRFPALHAGLGAAIPVTPTQMWLLDSRRRYGFRQIKDEVLESSGLRLKSMRWAWMRARNQSAAQRNC
jgi:hypothetical protein